MWVNTPNTAVQSNMLNIIQVRIYFTSKQILHFGFAKQNTNSFLEPQSADLSIEIVT